MSPRVCIVIPMYNESAIAQRSMETVLRYTKAFPKTTVLIVDDGSDDATEEIVRTHIEKDSSNQLVLVRHDMNQGYGAALKTGMRYTIDEGYDYAVFMDSDLTNHPKYLSGFYDAMSRGTQYIKATRYDGRGGMQGVPWQRQIMSRAGNGIARALYRLPISDPTNGFRAVHRSILQNLHLTENGFAIIMEELTQAQRLTKSFADVPYMLTSRGSEEGASNFSYSWDLCARYLKHGMIRFLYG